MAVLVDTGILYALADEDDAWHERARKWVERERDLLIVPASVLPEVAYLLHTRLGPGPELAFIQSLVAGEIDVEALRPVDLVRASEVMQRFPDLGFVDASLVAVAERLKVGAIATTDRRHFSSVVRSTWRFELLP